MSFDVIGNQGQVGALDRIDEVILLLSRGDRWCKRQRRSFDGRRCLVGAMEAANAAIMLKEAILMAAKQVTGRDYLRIEMFNDHPRTNHATILKVLRQARENIITGTVEIPASGNTRLPKSGWRVSRRPLSRLRRDGLSAIFRFGAM